MLVIGLGLSVAIAFWPNPNNTLPISHILNDEEVDISEALNLVVMSHGKDVVQLALVNGTPNKISTPATRPVRTASVQKKVTSTHSIMLNIKSKELG